MRPVARMGQLPFFPHGNLLFDTTAWVLFPYIPRPL
jgi:hypothetical protein